MQGRARGARGVLFGIAGLAGAVMLVVGTSWACTPQASLKLSPTAGPVGTKITVTGSTFDASGQAAKVWWGGPSKGQLLGTATVKADRTFSLVITVPSTSGGINLVSATQNDAAGQPIAGSPVNATFRVDAPAAAPAPANVQGDPDSTVTEPAAAAAPIEEPAPAPAVTPAPAPASAPRVRVAPSAPARTATPAPAPAPAPAAAAPATETAPAPAAAPAPVTPAPETATAAPPARRSVMVSMASDSDGSPALAIALVGVGLVLALGASALVLAGRRSDRKAPARARN